MEKFVDILSKLIIATITFVGPMIVFCFGIFYDALKLSHKERLERKKQIADSVFTQMSQAEVDRVKILEESSKKIKEKLHHKIWNGLWNPKIQIIIIFSNLFLSIGSLMLKYLIEGHVWGMDNKSLEKLLFRITFATYILAIIFITCFVMNIIKMKEKVEKSK